jgi:hypothetical protein
MSNEKASLKFFCKGDDTLVVGSNVIVVDCAALEDVVCLSFCCSNLTDTNVPTVTTTTINKIDICFFML